jgi:hypothetical protein
MTPLAWLRARNQGSLKHDWSPITITKNGHTLELEVSADAAMVDGVRANIGARGQQLLADALEALLPTATILAERHRQATVRLPPMPGDITRLTAAQHSQRIDQAIANNKAKVTAGAWIVSDVGKSWTIDRLSAPNVAIAEGFFFDSKADARGIPVGEAAVPGVFAVRAPGAPQVRAGKHGLNQGDGDPNLPTDYSQKALFVKRRCKLDGNVDDLGRIYADAALCALVSPDGKPLPARHPGVEALDHSPEWKKLEPPAAAAPAGGPPAWRDATKRGERAVAYARDLLSRGVRGGLKSPPSPDVAALFRNAVRDGQGKIGLALEKSGGNWCAVTACGCDHEAELPGDAPLPYLYRASGIEMQTDAQRNKKWHPVAEVIAGKWKPRFGDICILQRGIPGHSDQAWMRHVCRVTRSPGESVASGAAPDSFETIGGNEGDQMKVTTRRLHDGDLLGFIELPLEVPAAAAPADHAHDSAHHDLIALIEDHRDGGDPHA